MSHDWKNIFSYCLIGFNFLLALLILNWTICFSISRHAQCLKPRQPLIPILIGIFSIIFCVVDRSQVLLHSLLGQRSEYNGWEVVNALCLQLWTSTLFLNAWRAWNIYYEIKFNRAVKDKQWRLYINPAENNWFVKNRTRYGHPNKVMPAFVIPWFVTAILYIAYIATSNAFTAVSRSLFLLQALMALSFLIYIRYQIPKFDDIWRIRHELILTIRLYVIGVFVFFVFGLILNWQPSTWKYGLFSSLGTVAAFAQCCAVLLYPLKKFDLPLWCWLVGQHALYTNQQRLLAAVVGYKRKQTLQSGDIELELQALDEESRNAKMSSQYFKLKSILYHKNGCRLFAAHLMKELAIENLLFFIETSQWMHSIMRQCERDHVSLIIDERACKNVPIVKFHKNVPKSRIVSWNGADDGLVLRDGDVELTETNVSRKSATLNTISGGAASSHHQQLTIELNVDEFELNIAITDPWMQCVKLCSKYIVNGSYFCINISGDSRIKIYEKLGYETSTIKCDQELLEALKENLDNDINELFHIFDTARYAVFRLMIYSVARFESSDAYSEHFIPASPRSTMPRTPRTP